MNDLDALLKELNDPTYFTRNPNAAGMNDRMKPQAYNNPRFQQEPSPDQSPLKSPTKPATENQQEQTSGEKSQQNNMPNAPNSRPDTNKISDEKPAPNDQSPDIASPEMSPKPQKQAKKIVCATCKGQIKGKVVSCLGKTWHPEHFICQAGCKKLLDPNRFYEKNHLPCCENCHRESFIPRCAYCGDVISEKCITALGTTWHTDHFFCCQCAVQFPAGSGFLEKDGKAYCERDYYRLFATRCGKCGDVIVGEYISALGKEWHNKCFTCRECGCSFPTESFYEYKGMPYCETHYHLKRGSLCTRCNNPIVGRCISASGKKYHPEHFTCVQCNRLLATGMDDEYKEVNGHPLCSICASRLRV